MPNNLKSKLHPKNFDKNFIQQLDDFSCAAAACTTLARLYDVGPEKDLKFFRKDVKLSFDCAPFVDVTKTCRTHLPVEKIGYNIYHGGIALAYTRHKPDGDPHAIVYLAREHDTQIYFDPFEQKIFRDHVRNMAHLPHNCSYRRWTANFADIKGANFDFWNGHAKQNPYKLHDQKFWLKEHNKKLVL